MRKIFVIITALFIIAACKKNSIQNDCENLKQAILSSNAEMAKAAVNNIIATLPNQQYSQSNLQNLINRITADCDLTTELICFNCIYTLPAQSEIRISMNSQGSSQQKVLDLSYTENNRMTCLNMH